MRGLKPEAAKLQAGVGGEDAVVRRLRGVEGGSEGEPQVRAAEFGGMYMDFQHSRDCCCLQV